MLLGISYISGTLKVKNQDRYSFFNSPGQKPQHSLFIFPPNLAIPPPQDILNESA